MITDNILDLPVEQALYYVRLVDRKGNIHFLVDADNGPFGHHMNVTTSKYKIHHKDYALQMKHKIDAKIIAEPNFQFVSCEIIEVIKTITSQTIIETENKEYEDAWLIKNFYKQAIFKAMNYEVTKGASYIRENIRRFNENDLSQAVAAKINGYSGWYNAISDGVSEKLWYYSSNGGILFCKDENTLMHALVVANISIIYKHEIGGFLKKLRETYGF